MRKNIIFFNVKTQFNNLGDLIINKMLLNMLRAEGRLIVYVGNAPAWFVNQLGLSSEEMISSCGIQFLCSLVFHGLSSVFSRKSSVYFIRTPGHSFGTLKAGQIFSLFRNLFAMSFGIRICMFGVSSGPYSKTRGLIESWILNRIYFYSVRESISEKYAQKIGVKKVFRFPDPSWLIGIQSRDISGTPLCNTGEYVVFSFREFVSTPGKKIDYGKIVNPVLDIIFDIVVNKWVKKIVICYQVNIDRTFCKNIYNRYSNNCENVVFLNEQITITSMPKIYSRASLVFSNRLHALMLGTAYGALPIAVIDAAKHDKIRGIFLDEDLEDLIIDLNRAPQAAEKLLYIVKHADLFKEKINTSYRKNIKFSKQILHFVLTGEPDMFIKRNNKTV